MTTENEDFAGFRAEVRAFLAAELTPDLLAAPRTSQLIDAAPQQAWHRKLAKQGWAVPSWPAQFGGTGWVPRQVEVFRQELDAANAPPVSPFLESVVAEFAARRRLGRAPACALPRCFAGC